MICVPVREETDQETQGEHCGRDWGTSQRTPVLLETQEAKRKSWNILSPTAFRKHGSNDILIPNF